MPLSHALEIISEVIWYVMKYEGSWQKVQVTSLVLLFCIALEIPG